MNKKIPLSLLLIIVALASFGIGQEKYNQPASEIILQEDDNDENYILGHVSSWFMDDEANIYFSLWQECVIMKYSKDGKFLLKFGRKGEGPGEFTHISKIRQDGISIVISDGARDTYFSRNGSYIKNQKRDVKSSFCDADIKGEIIFQSCFDMKKKTTSLSLYKPRSTSPEIIEERQAEIQGDEHLFNWKEPYSITLNSKGIPVYAENEQFLIKEYRNGSVKILVDEKHEKRKIIYKDNNRKRLVGKSNGKDIYLDLPEFYSLISHITIDLDDNIWVYTISTDFAGFREFSRDGKALSKYPVECCPSIYAAFFVFRDYLYYRVNDEETGVKIYRIKLGEKGK